MSEDFIPVAGALLIAAFFVGAVVYAAFEIKKKRRY